MMFQERGLILLTAGIPQPGYHIPMKHYFPNVPGLGNIAVSRHAQARMELDGIPEAAFEAALLYPTRTIPDGQDVLWRERNGVRVVILTNPVPNRGAKLVKTVYRIKPRAAVQR